MIQTHKRGWLVLAVLVCTVAALGGSVSSCSNTSRKAAPSSTGTPALTNCQVLWASAATVQGRQNIFYIDAPIANWTSGSQKFTALADGPLTAAGYIYYEAEIGSNGNLITYQSSAVTTNGSYTVTDPTGTNAGDQVVLATSSSGTGYTFFAINGSGQLGNQAGTGGGGSFSGLWSDPATPNEPTPGTGQINVVYETSSLSLGSTVSYALCYNAASEFSLTPPRFPPH